MAMSFDPAYEKRFQDIFVPAIEAVEIDGQKLTPNRVDLSKSGDSILTEIIEGIAHCQFFLADISMVDRGARSGENIRNGNVMYEVGIALSCRNPSEILIVRDDQEKTLFDVSMVPHMHIDFSDTEGAKNKLTSAILDRIGQRKYEEDLRVKTILSSLTPGEFSLIGYSLQDRIPDGHFTLPHGGGQYGLGDVSTRLLVNRIAKRIDNVIDEKGMPMFEFTRLGATIAKMVVEYTEKAEVLRKANQEN